MKDAMTDAELLARMYERDYLTGEVFRSVYGPGYREPFEAYKKSRALPARVRESCIAFLSGTRPLSEAARQLHEAQTSATIEQDQRRG